MYDDILRDDDSAKYDLTRFRYGLNLLLRYLRGILRVQRVRIDHDIIDRTSRSILRNEFDRLDRCLCGKDVDRRDVKIPKALRLDIDRILRVRLLFGRLHGIFQRRSIKVNDLRVA